jgi:post-segregation antitoxin (ccd killing protein)
MMTEYEQVTLTFPVGLRDRAKKAGLNMSATASAAIENNVKKLEAENDS